MRGGRATAPEDASLLLLPLEQHRHHHDDVIDHDANDLQQHDQERYGGERLRCLEPLQRREEVHPAEPAEFEALQHIPLPLREVIGSQRHLPQAQTRGIRDDAPAVADGSLRHLLTEDLVELLPRGEDRHLPDPPHHLASTWVCGADALQTGDDRDVRGLPFALEERPAVGLNVMRLHEPDDSHIDKRAHLERRLADDLGCRLTRVLGARDVRTVVQ